MVWFGAGALWWVGKPFIVFSLAQAEQKYKQRIYYVIKLLVTGWLVPFFARKPENVEVELELISYEYKFCIFSPTWMQTIISFVSKLCLRSI